MLKAWYDAWQAAVNDALDVAELPAPERAEAASTRREAILLLDTQIRHAVHPPVAAVAL